jgi:hypothetical protein
LKALTIKDVIESILSLGQALGFRYTVNPDDLAAAERRFFQKIVNVGSLGIVAGDSDGIMANDLSINDNTRLG